MSNRDHNLMDETLARVERAHQEYTRMQAEMATLTNERDMLERENELLRAETNRWAEQYASLQSETSDRVLMISEDRDRFMMFAKEMTTQLALLDKMNTSQAALMSDTLKKAVEASKLVAFSRPLLTKNNEQEQEQEQADDGASEIAGKITKLNPRPIYQEVEDQLATLAGQS